MVSSSCGVASSGSDVCGSLGAVTLTSGSTLGIGNSDFPLEEGATGSISATLNNLRLTRLPSISQRWDNYGALVLLWRASLGAFWNEQHTSWGPWLVPLFLCTAPLDNPEFPWNSLGAGSASISAPSGSMKQSTSNFSQSAWLAALRQQLTGRWTFGPGHHSHICPCSEVEIEILSNILAHCDAPYVKAYPSAWTIRVGFHPLLEFLGFTGREAARLGVGDVERY